MLPDILPPPTSKTTPPASYDFTELDKWKKPAKFYSISPGHPMKVLWEALKDSSVGTSELIIAFALDPRCGPERRSTSEEGDMSSPMW